MEAQAGKQTRQYICGQCCGRKKPREGGAEGRQGERSSQGKSHGGGDSWAQPWLTNGDCPGKGRLWGDSRDIHADKKLGHVSSIQGYRQVSQSGRWRGSRWLGMLRYGTEESLEHVDALLRSLDLIIKALVGPLKDFKREGKEADIN